MKKQFLLIALLCIAIISGYSQNIILEKEAKIIELLELTGSANLGAQYAKSLLGNFRNTYDQVDEGYWDEIEKEINAEELIKLIIPIYDKYYTIEDLDQIIAFYKSPVGVKMIASMPQIMQESMEAGQIWGEELAKRIVEKLEDKNSYKRK